LKGKVFFFEKKKQKAFANCPLPPAHTEKLRRHPKQIKVFWFFFSKKNTFLAFLPVLFQ
jgi:hypothetical protein